MLRRAAILLVGMSAVVILVASAKKAPPAAKAPVAAGRVSVVDGPEALAKVLAEAGKDSKPVLVHFWATWCGACVEEFPKLAPVVARARTAGAAVLLVSLDPPEKAEKQVPAFLAKHGMTEPSLLLVSDDPAPIAKLLGAKQWDGELPATFVLKDGKTVFLSLGPVKDPGSLLDALR